MSQQHSGVSPAAQPLTRGGIETPITGSQPRALAGWGSVAGGVLLGWPFLRGIAGEGHIPVPFLLDPGVAPLATASIALGALALTLGLVGWWSLVGRSGIGRAATVILGLGLILWFIYEAALLAPDAQLPPASGVDLALVGAGSLLFATGLRGVHGLPADGLVLVGLFGPLAAALLGAPWPLGLGAVVPAVAVLYAVGWIRLGLSLLRAGRRTSA